MLVYKTTNPQKLIALHETNGKYIYVCVNILNAGVHLSGRQFAYLHVPYIYHLL